MQAVILAAGMGKRLSELTKNKTKCMVEVNGISLIERMLRQLDRKRLSRIVIVTGYEENVLTEYIDTLKIQTPIVYISNPVYDKTNNIYSLFLAREWLCKEDTLLLESDLIFEDRVLDLITEDGRQTLALVDKYDSWMDGTCMVLGENDIIERFVPKEGFLASESGNYYKTVNIYKFSREFSQRFYIPFLDAYMTAFGRNEYYERVLGVITMLDRTAIFAERLNGEKWYEIDNPQDLRAAAELFS